MHAVHAVAPAAEYVPEAHAAQPMPFSYVPARQPVQLTEPAAAMLPMGQAPQLDEVDAPVVRRYFPAAQLAQLVAPPRAW